MRAIVLTCAVLLTLSLFTSAETDLSDQMKTAEESFKFDGKAIHPGCVRQFNVGPADAPPPIVRAVDVEACVTSNENFMEFKTSDKGYVSYEYDIGEGEKGYFAYKYLGTNKDGTLALDTMSNQGGTMVAMTVMLIDFDTGEYSFFDDEGKKKTEKRLIMTCVSQITRGDRDSGTVTLKEGKLMLGKSQYRDKDEVIELEN